MRRLESTFNKTPLSIDLSLKFGKPWLWLQRLILLSLICNKELEKLFVLANWAHGVGILEYKDSLHVYVCLSFMQILYIHLDSILFILLNMQINQQWSKTTKPKMTVEWLQKVVTIGVETHFKSRWLRWWNSSMMSRVVNRFLVVDLKVLKFMAC
jgi:hypothetical protein